jgi:hypothetical protein
MTKAIAQQTAERQLCSQNKCSLEKRHSKSRVVGQWNLAVRYNVEGRGGYQVTSQQDFAGYKRY